LWHKTPDDDSVWRQLVRDHGVDHYKKIVVEGGLDFGDQRVSIDLIVIFVKKTEKQMAMIVKQRREKKAEDVLEASVLEDVWEDRDGDDGDDGEAPVTLP